MPLLNKLFGKKNKKEKKVAETEIKKSSVAEQKTSKTAVPLKSDILLSPLATEKAVSGQSLNKYIFKVAPKANKIDIIKAVSGAYNVKAISANIINIPKKARQVG